MHLKSIVRSCIEKSLKQISVDEINFTVEVPRLEKFGDFSTNVAMKLSPVLKKDPGSIAEELASILEGFDVFESLNVAKPGFINFKISNYKFGHALKKIENMGFSKRSGGEKILVEYGSANPTGPLHVGHGRNIVVGDIVANMLSFMGCNVEREYYINDAGVQIDNLALSLQARCREQMGEELSLPENGYGGQYMVDMAKEFMVEHGEVGLTNSELVRKFALEWSLNNISNTLDNLGVRYDSWVSEASLHEGKAFEDMLAHLKKEDLTYEEGGALWSKTTKYGDDKDRVIVKSDGTSSYYASDILYSKNKVDRGFKKMVTMLGADHHGYVIRFDATFSMWGAFNSSILIQMVQLYKGKELVKMSKRAGQFYTLNDLLGEVESDVVRAFFLMRKSDTPLDFDLDLAKSKSNENPYYYVQYAHARIASILREEEALLDLESSKDYIFTSKDEKNLIKALDEFWNVVEEVKANYSVHLILSYAKDLSSLFHTFYGNNRVLVDDQLVKQSRLALILQTQRALGALLKIMGITPLERM